VSSPALNTVYQATRIQLNILVFNFT
jgi:hypothetical protein